MRHGCRRSLVQICDVHGIVACGALVAAPQVLAAVRSCWARRSSAEVRHQDEQWRFKLLDSMGPGPRQCALSKTGKTPM